MVRSLINETLQECKTALTLQSLNLFWVIVLKKVQSCGLDGGGSVGVNVGVSGCVSGIGKYLSIL